MDDSLLRECVKGFDFRVPSLLNNDVPMTMLLHVLDDLGYEHHIDSVYGSYRTSWNSGRPSLMSLTDVMAFEEVANLYEGHGVGVSLTFNNYNVTYDDLDEDSPNKVLDVLENDFPDSSSVIVSSDLLARYIRDNFPHVRIIGSVIRPIYDRILHRTTDDVTYYLDLMDSGLYDMVTPRPEFFFSTSNEELNKVSDKDRFIVLCNQSCMRDCPFATAHHDLYERVERGEPYDTKVIRNCMMVKSEYRNIDQRCVMGVDDLRRMRELGFTHMKLQGRNLKASEFLDMLGTWVYEPIGRYQGMKESILSAMSIEYDDKV